MIKCKICEEEFDKSISFNYHLKKVHEISYKDYLIENEFGGVHPTCMCGCGELVSFSTRRISRDRMGFCKYYKNHYEKVQSELTKGKVRDMSYLSMDITLSKYNLSCEKIESLYNEYVSFSKSMSEIKKEVLLDKRTIINWWNKLNLIKDKTIFQRIQKKHQGHWKPKKEINSDTIFNIYQFIKSNPNLFTISNLKNKFKVEQSRLVLQRSLYESFGKEEVDKLLTIGNSSRPEMDLYFVLVYFFGQKNVKRQFKIEKKYYDFKLGDRILIEFDGTYWHSKPENIEKDKVKDNLAIKNGYILFRIKESESRNIEILKKLEKLWKKNQK